MVARGCLLCQLQGEKFDARGPKTFSSPHPKPSCEGLSLSRSAQVSPGKPFPSDSFAKYQNWLYLNHWQSA
jgi:hypothetical protein